MDVEPSVKQPRKQHPPPPPRVLQKPVAKPKPVISKSSTNATKTQFVKPLIIRPRTSSTDTNSLKGRDIGLGHWIKVLFFLRDGKIRDNFSLLYKQKD